MMEELDVMEKLYGFDFYNEQSFAVFSDYKIYQRSGVLKNLKSKLYDYKPLLDRVIYKGDRLLYSTESVMYEDLKLLADYLEISIDELFFIITEQKNFKKYVKPSKYNSVIAVSNQSEKYSFYNLHDTKSFHTKLAKIEPFNEQQIIEFCKNFGIPFGQTKQPEVLAKEKMFFPISNYLELNLNLMLYREFFNNCIDYKTKNYTRISERMLSQINKKFELEIYGEEYKRYWGDDLEKLHNNDEEFILKTVLDDIEEVLNSNKINKNLFGSFITQKNNEIIPGKYFNNLLEFAYVKTVHGLISGKNYKACKYCNHLFEADDLRMLFCPPHPLKIRSTCELAYNYRMNIKE